MYNNAMPFAGRTENKTDKKKATKRGGIPTWLWMLVMAVWLSSAFWASDLFAVGFIVLWFILLFEDKGKPQARVTKTPRGANPRGVQPPKPDCAKDESGGTVKDGNEPKSLFFPRCEEIVPVEEWLEMRKKYGNNNFQTHDEGIAQGRRKRGKSPTTLFVGAGFSPELAKFLMMKSTSRFHANRFAKQRDEFNTIWMNTCCGKRASTRAERFLEGYDKLAPELQAEFYDLCQKWFAYCARQQQTEMEVDTFPDT